MCWEIVPTNLFDNKVNLKSVSNSTPTNNDFWVDSSDNRFKFRENGITKNLDDAPGNYFCTVNYTDDLTNINKSFVDTYFTVVNSTITPNNIPFSIGFSGTEQYCQAVYMMQKFMEFFGNNDNDIAWDGTAPLLAQQIGSNTNFFKGATRGNQTLLGSSGTDVDCTDNANSPSEYFKLIIGARNNVMYFITIAPAFTSGFGGIKFVSTANQWVSGDSNVYPLINTTNAFVTSGTPTTSNNVVGSSTPACYLVPIRLTLQ